MIERQLAVIPYKNHLLSAVFQGNELYDIIVEPAEAEQTIATGDIYLAKVKNVVPNIQAAFLEVTKNNMCYLPLKKEEFSEVMQGMEFPVQIIKPAVKSKQPVCSRKLELAGMYAVITTDITTKNISKKINAKKILDLCTGSGAIAISLAKYIENSEITAVDISKKALEIARTNAKNNDVENQITFVESDLFKNLKEDKYDVIVSNPPYIKREVIKKLNKDVQKEPIIALDGGYDGLDFYRKIINESEKYLKFNGYLCFEISYDQKEDVIGIIKNKERYINTYSKKDLYGNDRIIITKLS